MKATLIIFAMAAVSAIKVKPMSIDDQASVDFLDEKRQDHSNTVIGHLAGNTFQGDWNDLKRYHETVVSQQSWNEHDSDYEMEYPYGQRSIHNNI